MNTQAHTQTQATKSGFTPAPMSLVQRKCACGGSAGLSGECEECQKGKLTGESASLMQPKLKISQPDDKYEQEADRIADEVMRMPEPRVQRQTGSEEEEEDETIQREAITSKTMPLVQRQVENEEEDEETEDLVQRKSTGPTPSSSYNASHPFLRNLGLGRPLDASTRSFFEPRLGCDLSHIRVHANDHAAESAHSLQAKAYTIGRDVVFGAGQFATGTHEGQRLLAHELAHAVLQNGERSVISRDAVIYRKACPEECLNCPASGVVSEGCECFGVKQPNLVVPVPIRVRIVCLFGAGTKSTIKRHIRQANKTWKKGGIEVDAQIQSIDRSATEKILGKDDKGRLRKNIMISPIDRALDFDSTRALLGLPTAGGNENFSVPAGRDVHSLVIYYVPEFNQCDNDPKSVGCAFPGTAGRFFVLIEKNAQDVAMAHELGHMWGLDHVSDKRNVMFPAPAHTGLDADQIRKARQTLKLGGPRCLASGATVADRERMEKEQETELTNSQLLLREIEGRWRGTVTVNGTDRSSGIDFVIKENEVFGNYRYKTGDEYQYGKIKNGMVTGGTLNYDWQEGQSTGKGSFQLMLMGMPGLFGLLGRWGIGQSSSDGGSWFVLREGRKE